MTVCNMTIEGGARAGLIAPDETTFDYIKGRRIAPKGEAWEQAVAYWKTLPTDPGAHLRHGSRRSTPREIAPMVTWGTTPRTCCRSPASCPTRPTIADEGKRARGRAHARVHGPDAGHAAGRHPVDVVFIGSCTNGRIEDLRAAAAVAKGRKVAAGVQALVVPGSGLVKQQAEEEGLDRILLEAGFEWREPGCSMCLGMNPDKLSPASAAPPPRTAISRAARAGRPHPPGVPGDGRGRRGHRPPGRCARLSDRRGGARRMDKFTTLTGVAAPMPMENIDTDKIIPARFLKTIKRTGLGRHLFDELRFTNDGTENPDFVLNQPAYRKAKIIVADENFGCGSSREHAPWALLDFGIRCVIAPSFADIFYNNCFKNGILPIRLPRAICRPADGRRQAAAATPCITDRSGAAGDRAARTAEEIQFDIDPFRKHLLLNGLDDIGQTLQHAPRDRRLRRRSASKPRSPGCRSPRSEPGGHADARQQEAADPAGRRHRPGGDARGPPRHRLDGPPPHGHASTSRKIWSAAPRSMRAARRSPTRRCRRRRTPTPSCSARSAARNGTSSAFELRPERGILRLRKELDLFANLRPAMVFDPLVDASTLKPDVVARPRPDDRARKHRRHLFRRAARHRDAAGRQKRGFDTEIYTDQRDRARRPRRLRSGAQAAEPRDSASRRPT